MIVFRFYVPRDCYAYPLLKIETQKSKTLDMFDGHSIQIKLFTDKNLKIHTSHNPPMHSKVYMYEIDNTKCI